MLELKNIKKDYALKDQEPVHALKGISLNFRNHEFVSILGHSGCGKTTLLNITGGLDHYDDGDLIIKGVSTKNFKDNDWDTYRNHSIGFVFQTYNLIPHQTILKNVELALTISGLKKEERIKRAKDALDSVGLAGLYRKKPNQLSGGQMQRVAIARALVNNPEIVLADEPTGALDSETSVQIMELLKEVSNTHLVIMVTHNPDLAEQYSTRIVRMKDGEIVSDSNPFDGKEEKVKEKKKEETVSKGKKQSSMSFFTAFGLSVSNLLSKIKRTVLVAVAGSIGIIGVSTIIGVSCGVNNYIDDMQNDMLSSYPLQIAEESVDLTSLITGLTTQQKREAASFDTSTRVGMDSMIAYLLTKYTDFTNVKTNDITQTLIDYIDQMPSSYYSSIHYDYGIDPTNNFFTFFKSLNGGDKVISFNGLTQRYIKTLMTVEGFEEYAQFVDLFTSFMKPIPGDKDYILSQYDLIGNSTYPEGDDQLLLVVDDKTTLTDLVLAQMGYYPEDQFLHIAEKAVEENKLEKQIQELKKKPQTPEVVEQIRILEEKIKSLDTDPDYYYDRTFTYEDILNHEFYYFPHNSIYQQDPDFVSHRSTNISLTGEFTNPLFSMYPQPLLAVASLNYDNAEDQLSGTVLILDNENNIVSPTPIPVMFNRTQKSGDVENGSFVDGKWEFEYNGLQIALENASGNKSSYFDPTRGVDVYSYTTSADLTLPYGIGKIAVSGKTTEIESKTKDYWYNSELSSEMRANPEAYGGKKVTVKGILRAKETTNFGSLSRGVYYTREFAEAYRTQAKASQINQTLTTHITEENFDISPFNAYVYFTYDDYKTGEKGKEGFASSLNGDLSSNIMSIFASFMTSEDDNLDADKLHLRALSGLKVHEEVISETPKDVEYSIRDVPESISIYPKDFVQKDNIMSYLGDWNSDATLKIKGVDVPRSIRSEITVTDTISMIIETISTLVTTVSAALIAFTSLSLVVSCFMIAVITYISVMERIKEIGVIRSLGGRKKDVSRLFIAENLITGLSSGVLGIAITYVLQMIINIIVKGFGVSRISALPWYYALMMIGISVLLSVMSGLIPSLSASKQDPVIALRTE